MCFLSGIRITEGANDSNSAYCQDFSINPWGIFVYGGESASNTLTSNFGIPLGIQVAVTPKIMAATTGE